MRWIVATLVWTAIVMGLILFVPGVVDTPGCASHVEPSAECLDLMAAQNDTIWWTHTLPLLLVIASGYIAIGIALLRSRRTRTT